jgi:hypothetical protein
MEASNKDCEAYARECVRLANLITDPKLHESLMQMAREWMAVAMHEQKAPDAPMRFDRRRAPKGMQQIPPRPI